jgi:hypothetical protein
MSGRSSAAALSHVAIQDLAKALGMDLSTGHGSSGGSKRQVWLQKGTLFDEKIFAKFLVSQAGLIAIIGQDTLLFKECDREMKREKFGPKIAFAITAGELRPLVLRTINRVMADTKARADEEEKVAADEIEQAQTAAAQLDASNARLLQRQNGLKALLSTTNELRELRDRRVAVKPRDMPGMLMVKNRGKNRGKTGENRAETGPPGQGL